MKNLLFYLSEKGKEKNMYSILEECGSCKKSQENLCTKNTKLINLWQE